MEIRADTTTTTTTSSRTMTHVLESAELRMNKMMDEWCNMFAANCSGGEMRYDRGNNIETFVSETINDIGKTMNVDFVSKCGATDKKELKIPGTEIMKKHQVDVHIYRDGEFVAVIECKAYLDSCYYTRACDDFKLFKKFGYDIKKFIFTLEDAMAVDTKTFIDYETDDACDGVFYLLDGKRTGSKPVYNAEYKKSINKNSLSGFVDVMHALGTGTTGMGLGSGGDVVVSAQTDVSSDDLSASSATSTSTTANV